MSRSYCFWRTDFNCNSSADPIGLQVGNYGTNFWTPMISGSRHPKGSTYVFRSGLNGGTQLSLTGSNEGETEPSADTDVEWIREMLNQYQTAKPYFFGDYYPLTGCDTRTDSYMAYQLDRPDLESGIILAFRRQDCETLRFSVTATLEKGVKYEFLDVDTGKERVIVGGDSYEFVFKDKPGSAFIHYTRKK